MLKLDFLNKDYSLEEVIQAFTDGDIENFKGDNDFLDFLISYSLGKYLEGDDADKYMDYSEYDGLFKIMRLDEYGYFGKTLYQIYEICGKDKTEFMKTCELIGTYAVKHSIEKKTVDTNLSLKKPVKFADDSIVLSSGLKPIYNPKNKYKYADGLSFDDEQELNHEMERSLRHRINMSIKENNDQVELLEEMPSYVEQERISKEEAEAKRVKDDYKIDIDNLYYGTEQYSSEDGAMGFSMTLVSWFEYMNMDIMNYHVFRSVPLGDICLIDNNGKIHIPEEIMSKGNVEVGPNTPIRGVKIMSIINIVKEGLKKAEAADDEMSILELKGIIEHLEDKEKIKVSELGIYESTIRNLFEQTQGNIFSDDGKDVEVEKDDDNENTHHI